MATTAVYARIDDDLKNSAEEILLKLGISPSSAVQMLYSQIVLRNGLPFDLHLPPTALAPRGLDLGSMTRAQFEAAVKQGMDGIRDGEVVTTEELDADLAKEFGI